MARLFYPHQVLDPAFELQTRIGYGCTFYKGMQKYTLQRTDATEFKIAFEKATRLSSVPKVSTTDSDIQ